MRNRVMIVLGFVVLVWVSVFMGTPVAVWAQADRAQRIAGFEVPDYDSEMRLRSMLFGDFARIMPGGEVEITNMRIEFYTEDDEVEMQVSSPECVYDRTTSNARSDAEIHIARDNMIIMGRGYVWNAEDGRFEIFNDARVLLKGLGKNLHLGGLE